MYSFLVFLKSQRYFVQVEFCIFRIRSFPVAECNDLKERSFLEKIQRANTRQGFCSFYDDSRASPVPENGRFLGQQNVVLLT